MTAPEPAEVVAEPMTVHEALVKVSAGVGNVGKEGYSEHGKFNFRGVDAVVNAVAPELRRHGVTVHPVLKSVERRTAPGSSGKALNFVAVVVDYVFTGPAGDTLTATVPGESFDSGDKATAKAMSVAFRTCLLQTLTLPTDAPDPDEYIEETAAAAAVAHAAAEGPQQTGQAAQTVQDHMRERWDSANGLRQLGDWIYHSLSPQEHYHLDAISNRIAELESMNNG